MVSFDFPVKYFLQYLALDITATCICETHCLALDAFDLNTVHKLSSKEKKFSAEPGFKPGAAGWEATQPHLCSVLATGDLHCSSQDRFNCVDQRMV